MGRRLEEDYELVLYKKVDILFKHLMRGARHISVPHDMKPNTVLIVVYIKDGKKRKGKRKKNIIEDATPETSPSPQQNAVCSAYSYPQAVAGSQSFGEPTRASLSSG